ncbi:hypothetical protein J31TS6_00870 [Brevibacillus reuszeri]|nr:hypothetical protein J31TS6_00870 [Brevibacillus reuszeri]
MKNEYWEKEEDSREILRSLIEEIEKGIVNLSNHDWAFDDECDCYNNLKLLKLKIN